MIWYNVSSLQLKQSASSNKGSPLIWCDTSISAISPVVAGYFPKNEFHKLCSLSHPDIKSPI